MKQPMLLFVIRQDVNVGYDTYDSAVVAAESAEIARTMHPAYVSPHVDYGVLREWAKPKDVKVTLLGTALKGQHRTVIVASFNAG